MPQRITFTTESNNNGETEKLIQRSVSNTSITQQHQQRGVSISRQSVTGSTRSSVLGRQYANNYNTTGYDVRDPEERESIHASDSGLQIHAEPTASALTTFLNITCNIVGVGVLAIPTAVEGSSLGFGMILIVLFELFSAFASYTLSVGCEYTQYFSQAQLLCHCLTGYADPNWNEELDGEIEQGGATAEEQEHHQQQQYDTNTENDDNKSNASSNNITPVKKLMKRNSSPGSSTPMMTNSPQTGEGAGAYGFPSTVVAAAPGTSTESTKSSKNGRRNNNNNSSNGGVTINNSSMTTIESQQQQQQKGSTSRSVAEQQQDGSLPTVEDVAVAEDKAVREARKVNLVLDLLLGCTYFCYLVAYARVVADSMTNVSKDIGLPHFFQETYCWLLIGGVVFLSLSMRRVFQEMKITSIIGIITIYFVIVCLIVRYIKPDDFQPDRNSPGFGAIRWWVLDGKFLNAFSTLSGAFGYQVNHPSFYQELQDRTPASMQKPVITSMSLVAGTYILTGYLGYTMFGSAITSDQIGGNIVNGFGANDILINVARVGLFIHFVCVFPLIAGAVRQCLHRVGLRLFGLHDRADDPDEVFKIPFTIIAIEVLLIVVGSVVIAGVVPGIAVVIDIAGCLGGTFALMILPGIVGMLVYPELEKRLSDNDESVTQMLSSVEFNNFLGFIQFSIPSKVLYWLSASMVVIGVAATIGGFIVVLGSL